VVTEYFLESSVPTEHCPLHPEDFGGWLNRTVRGIGDWLGGGRERGEREP
jgi:hypothetical protein